MHYKLLKNTFFVNTSMLTYIFKDIFEVHEQEKGFLSRPTGDRVH